jgi:hypothetical protein
MSKAVSRVRIGTCSGPADAALVRSMFSAHGIDVVIGAGNHASLLGGLGGGFLSLDIWIDEADSEDATALLRDLRERDERDGEGDEDDEYDGNEAGDQDSLPREAPTSSVHQRVDRRRRTAVALLLGTFVSFGTAHMFTGAWMRGLALAGLEVVGFLHVRDGFAVGFAAIAGAVVTDLIGAVWRVRALSMPALPAARLRASRPITR